MNKKGFTLVELLAVIVILAILMVSAGAAVMSTLNNARVNTFKNEALSAISVADNMYTEISMSAADSNKYLKNDTTSVYKGMCVTLNGLVRNGYLNKDLGEGATKGVILIEVPFDGGATKKSIWITNSTYVITGYEQGKISGLKFKTANNDGLAGKMYWQEPKKDSTVVQGVVTKDDNAIKIINAAHGAVTTIETSATTTANVTKYPSGTLSATNQKNAYKSSSVSTIVGEFHSPVTSMGGTGLVYKDIPCINAPIA